MRKIVYIILGLCLLFVGYLVINNLDSHTIPESVSQDTAETKQDTVLVKKDISQVLTHLKKETESSTQETIITEQDTAKTRQDIIETKEDTLHVQALLEKGTEKEEEIEERIIKIGDKEIEIKGNMSFAQIEYLTGVPASYLIEKLKLPSQVLKVSRTANLGNLRKIYGFQMQDVRKYIREYLKIKNLTY
ncbi:hypothetical protein AMJ80_08980 [bacterium SM23_31]|nr:MAG: hypothetical protein AMJ80_08980 [bacterium SM23_31]